MLICNSNPRRPENLEEENLEGEQTPELRVRNEEGNNRSHVTYHVMVNRGSRDMTTNIYREENQTPDEDNTSGSDDDVGTTAFTELVTLHILSQLLGGNNVRQRFRRHVQQTQDIKEEPPKATPMDPTCHLYQEIKCNIGQSSPVFTDYTHIIEKTRARQYSTDPLSCSQKLSTTSEFLPRHCCVADSFESRVFCGSYSNDGDIFVCAPQDSSIRLYNTEGSKFNCYKSVDARGVGWSVLSTALSPDQNWFVYSTWSRFVNICNVHGEEEHHYSLDLYPEDEYHFCVFYVTFSKDNREIFSATSDGIFIYDREKQTRTVMIDAHQDDANGIAFSDSSGHVIYSTGDDGLCKVWDRRTLEENSPCPVGVFAGHKDGITYVDSKEDGRYLITNSKDQSIKLWDIRKFSSSDAIDATIDKVARQRWDYRWQDVPRRALVECHRKLPGDSSIMTYTGHCIKNTLIRCKFSPSFTTGQRYIYTGCANGRVIIYDILTGEIVHKLITEQCNFCVRDVSWHPYQIGTLAASTWDGTLNLWTHEKRDNYVDSVNEHQQIPFW